MKYQFNDGGRAQAGYKGLTGDCACRSIAIATGKPYQEVYDLILSFAEKERNSKKTKLKGFSHPRTGVWKDTFKKIMAYLGWKWTPTMLVGQGCKVHMRSEELPAGKIICLVSRHYVAVIDGVLHDTYDSSRDENRCVYGYFHKP